VTKMSFDNWAVEGSNAPTWVTNGVSKANFYSPAPSILSTNTVAPSPVRSIRGKAPEAARPFTGDWDAVVSTNTPTWVTSGVAKDSFYSPAPSNSVLPPRAADRQLGLPNADTWNESPDRDVTGSGDMFLTGPFSRLSPAPAPAPAPASPQYGAPRIPTVPEKRFDKDGAYPTASNTYGSLAPFSVPPQSVVQSGYGGSEYGSRRVQPYGDPASTSGNRPRRDSRDPFAESGESRPEDPTRQFEDSRRWSSAPTPVSVSRESLDGAYPTNSGSYGGSIAPYARTNQPNLSPQDYYERSAYGRSSNYPRDQRPESVLNSGGYAENRKDEYSQDEGGRSREYPPRHIDSKSDLMSGQSGNYKDPSTYGDSPGRDEFSRSSSFNGYQPMHDDRRGDHERARSDRYSSQSASRRPREGEPRGAGQNGRSESLGWQSEANARSSTSDGYRSSEYATDSPSSRTNQDSRSASSPGDRNPGRSERQNNDQGFGRTVSSPERHAPGGWNAGGQSPSSSTSTSEGEYRSSSSSRGEGSQSSSGGYQSSGSKDGRDTWSPGSSSRSRSASSTSSSASSSSGSTSQSSSSTTPPQQQQSIPAPPSSSGSTNNHSRPKSYSAFGSSKPKAPGGNSAFGGSGGYLSGF
jgi:hypothetical protein